MDKEKVQLPEWFTEEQVQTVITAFPDVYGRLMGKRMTREFFLEHAIGSGMHSCNYLMTVDIAMEIMPGFKVASWDKGFGDFRTQLDISTLRLLPWHDRTAVILGDMFDADDRPVAESPRRVLARQLERLAERGQKACLGSELEFFLYNENYHEAHDKHYSNLTPASDYSIDYHILQPGRDEDVLARIRSEMTAAGITVECSKGETGKGQHEVNLLYTEAMEMADRHTLYKTGAKDIANQEGRSITFMAKPFDNDAGSGLHIHTSLWNADGKTNLFYDAESKGQSEFFRYFLGGLLILQRKMGSRNLVAYADNSL